MLTFIKNVVSIIIAIFAIFFAFNAYSIVVQSSIHQIYTTCNYILATLLGIWSYLLADFTSKDSA